MFDFLFGRRKTPQEVLRENTRFLNRSIREIDRERTKLEQAEKKTLMEIKQYAKNGNMNASKVMARDLVRSRRQIQKFYKMRTSLQGLSLKIQGLSSGQQMAQSMKNATKAMKMMNNSINLPGLQKLLLEFEKQSEIMDMKEEIMGETMDEAFEDSEAEEDEEEESEQIVKQIMDEINIKTTHKMADVPSGIIKEGEASMVSANSEENQLGGIHDTLQARLNNLKRE